MEDFVKRLFDKYELFLNKNISERRFKHNDYLQEINKFESDFEITLLGKSFENREIKCIKVGNGKTNIMFWSQMHGNEPTASLAILDILNFFNQKSEFQEIINTIVENCTLWFIPVLNPDGAELFIRRNAQGIDLNRDAIRLSAPESIILKDFRDRINPEFGFNLHDQELYYAVSDTLKPTTLAFLAPSYNPDKEINKERANSMQLIAAINKMLQSFIPEQIAKYSDEYMPNAFGDTIQKSGTSTILIESGFFKNDAERQFVRKLNFISIIYSLSIISKNEITNYDISDYHKIPQNKRDVFFDYLIKNITVSKKTGSYKTDIGISRDKSDKESFTDYSTKFLIWEIGDLSAFSGHRIVEFENEIITDFENNIKRFADADFLITKYFGIKLDIE